MTGAVTGILSSTVQGVYFDGKSSRDHDATLHLGHDRLTLSVPDAGLVRSWRAQEVELDPPIPGVRRSLKFPDGSRFESRDDASISAWEQQTGRNRMLGRVRGLESRWGTALGALVVAVLAVWGFIQYGIPAMARQAAAITPRSVLKTFDDQTVKLLQDQEFLAPTKLSAARQAQLQQEFKQVAAWAGGGYPYQLLLRNGQVNGEETIGPNAFALPNGTVVMTDQLVALAKNDREIMGVLAHETGHVTHRHALSSVYQALGLAVVTTAFTGDLVSSTTFAAAVPATLLKGGYSRAAETDADEVSGTFMLKAYGTTRPLQDILARLEKSVQDKHGQSSKVDDMLSTHPGTPLRIEHLKAMEQQALGAGK